MSDADKSAPSAPVADDAVTDDAAIWAEMDTEDAGKASHDGDAPEADLAPNDDPQTPAPDDDADPSPDTPQEANKADADPEPVSIEALQEQTERLEQQLESEKGRSRGQQRRADRLQQRLDELEKSQAAKPSDDDEAKRKEALTRITEEYGDMAAPLVDEIQRLNSKVGDLSEADKRQLDLVKGELDDLVAEETAKLETEHPDGMDVLKKNGAAFREWIDDQPKAVRDAFEANYKQIVNGTQAAWVIGKFKEHIAEGQDGAASKATAPSHEHSSRRSRQMAGAQTTRSKPRRVATMTEPPADADPEDIWAHYDEVDRRKAAQG